MSEKKLKQAFNRSKELEEILDEQIKMALREHKRPTIGLFLSAFTAGLEVSFSYFLICIMHYFFSEEVSNIHLHLILAFSYPLGFIFVVIGRSELFTEHTTLAILPVLTGSVTIRSLMALWVTIFVGNILGGYLFSALMISIGPAMSLAREETFIDIALHVISYPWQAIFLSALMAGWLMGLLAWLVTAARETISQIFIIILVTSVIGIGGLHHAIVGSTEVFTGLLVSPRISFWDYFSFQTWATLGNIVGGVFFVGILKYSHGRNIRA